MPMPKPSDLHGLLAQARLAQRLHTPSYQQRMDDLARLRGAFKAKLECFIAAISADFGRRPRHESLLSEGMTVLNDIDHVCRQLGHWMQPKRTRVNWLFFPARAEIRYQPLGVVGIISPWNYPLNLALKPLIAAIGAGNHVLLKPSEHTPRTAELLKNMLEGIFPQERVTTVLGGPDIAAAFTALPFDHLFFTGSTATGKRVMTAAAANLTPLTLELGGKSPAVIAPDYPVAVAVKRIATGKFLNAGQTCIAPDYVLLPRQLIPAFVDEMQKYILIHYPNLANNPDYASIINAHHYLRLNDYLDEARANGAQVIELATGNTEQRVLPPILVLNAAENLRLMQEEIFGPILPLVAVDSVDAAIDYVNARPRPLALYYFDFNQRRINAVLNRTVAGGVSINDTVMQFAQTELPFGGIGASGMGQYHGHAGFLTFSHQKSVLHQARWTSMALMRPPYRKVADFLTRFLTR